MEQLVKVLQERIGLPEDKARMAVSIVLEHVKKMIPAQFAGQFETLMGMGGAAGEESQVPAEVSAGIGKFFGGSGQVSIALPRAGR